jgi:hypothetical protein
MRLLRRARDYATRYPAIAVWVASAIGLFALALLGAYSDFRLYESGPHTQLQISAPIAV